MATHTQGPSLLNRALVRAEGWRDRGSAAQRLYPTLAHSAAEPRPSAPRPSASIAAALYPNLAQASEPNGGKP
jgi:hypothetical protein